MEGETKVNEEEEFEFRLRLEQEQGQDDTLRLGRLPPEIPEAPTKDNLFNLQTQSGIMKGMTDPAAGAAQLLTRITPPSLNGVKPEDIDKGIERREKQYQERRSAEGEEGMDWARIGGNVISPASAALMQAKVPLTIGGRIKQGMAMGGGMGASQPVTDSKADYATTKAMQTGLGTTAGGAIPIAGEGIRGIGRYGKEFVRPFTKKGITKDVIKYINENVGSGKEKIIKALQDAKEIVPGNKPTSGQAISQANLATRANAEKQLESAIRYAEQNFTGEAKEVALKMARETADVADDFGGHIIKLEKDLMKAASSGDKLKALKAQHLIRRKQALGVSDDASIDSALAKTTQKSDELYEKAWSHKVDYDPELGGIMNNEFIQDVLPGAVKSAKWGKTPVSSDELSQFLHKVKLGLDDKLNAKVNGEKAVKGLKRADIKAIKTKLVDWLEKKNPYYKDARLAHAEGMKGVDSMRLSKLNKASLVDDAGGDKGIAFSRASESNVGKVSKYAKKAEDIQGKAQAESNKRVIDDVINQQNYKNMATSTEAVPKIGGEVEFQLPHILSRPIVVANTILKKIGQDKTPEYKKILSDILENPAELERILKLPAGNPKVKMAMDIMNKLSTTSTAQSAGRGAQ